MMNAPIIVFAYNRPNHLKQTLQALAANSEAIESDLYIFIDGPKNEKGYEVNREVVHIAENFAKGYFRAVNIKNHTQNRGLACSVISGVSEIIEEYGRVIVTEDDAVSAPSYLKFMNQALDYYRGNQSIWSVGGYTIPMQIPQDYQSDVILTQRSSSYAWATWKERWETIDWEMKDYRRFHWNFIERCRFNQWGDDRASMLDDQMLGRVNSWAIRFDYAMFKNHMFNVLPTKSLIANIGHDGSGTHSTSAMNLQNPFKVDLKNAPSSFVLDEVEVDERIRKAFCKPFHATKTNLTKRFVGNFIRSIR